MSQQNATPKITAMQVIPVAGYDSMLLNIGGAHSAFFKIGRASCRERV